MGCSFVLVTALAGAVTDSRLLRLIVGLFVGLILPLVVRIWVQQQGGARRAAAGARRRRGGRLWFVVSWNLALLLAICLPFSDSAGRALQERGDWFLGSRRGALPSRLRASVTRAGRLLECLDALPGAGRCSRAVEDSVDPLELPPGERPERPRSGLELPPDRRFDRFSARLSTVASQRSGRLRITILGDSHMAARVFPRRLAWQLKQRFGDGGRGFELRGKRWPAPEPRPGGVHTGPQEFAATHTAGGGAVVDTLALDGARAATLLRWDEEQKTAFLRRLQPDLIVVAFGSNDLGGKAATWRRWVTLSYDRLLRGVQRALPQGACLVLGPLDQARRRQGKGWVRPRRLDVLETIQRRLALQHGCAFWSQRAVMGGPGSMLDWVRRDPPLARRDHLHLTARGYRQMADQLHAALMLEWARWTRWRR